MYPPGGARQPQLCVWELNDHGVLQMLPALSKNTSHGLLRGTVTAL